MSFAQFCGRRGLGPNAPRHIQIGERPRGRPYRAEVFLVISGSQSSSEHARPPAGTSLSLDPKSHVGECPHVVLAQPMQLLWACPGTDDHCSVGNQLAHAPDRSRLTAFCSRRRALISDWPTISTAGSCFSTRMSELPAARCHTPRSPPRDCVSWPPRSGNAVGA